MLTMPFGIYSREPQVDDSTDQSVAPGVIERSQRFLRKRGFAIGFRIKLSVRVWGPVLWLLLLLLLFLLFALPMRGLGAEIRWGNDVGGGSADVLDGAAELGDCGVGGRVRVGGAEERGRGGDEAAEGGDVGVVAEDGACWGEVPECYLQCDTSLISCLDICSM